MPERLRVTVVTVTQLWSALDMAHKAREGNRDPLNQFEEIKLVDSYITEENKHTQELPFLLDAIKGVTTISLKGWQKDISNISNKESLPQEIQNFLKYLRRLGHCLLH